MKRQEQAGKVERPTGPREALLILALVLAETTSAFEVSMIYSALPTLNRTFGDPLRIGWVITSCLIMSALAAALCSRFGDLYGRRRALLWVIAGCALGSFISASSSTLSGVILGATIQGLSGAILPLCFGLARELFTLSRVPLVIGIIVSAASLGSGVGLFLGGVLVDHFEWRAIFIASGSMAVLGWLVVTTIVPARRGQRASTEGIDVVRGVLFAPAIAGALFAVTQARSWGLLDWRILAMLAASLLLLAFWASHQWRQPNPLINVRFFAQRQIGLAYLCMAAAALGTMQLAQIMSLFLQHPAESGGMGLSATQSGGLLMPALWVGLLAAPASGKLAQRYGARAAAILGAAVLSASWLSLLLFHADVWQVAGAITGVGMGYSILYAALPNLIVESAPPERVSEATGVAAVIRAVFMAIGAQLVMVIMSLGADAQHTERQDTPAFRWMFTYTCVMCLIALAGACLARRARAGVPKQAHADAELNTPSDVAASSSQ